MLTGSDPGEFHALADLLPEPMLLVGADGRVAAANQAAQELLSLAPAALQGAFLQDLVLEAPAAIADLLKASSRTRSLVPGRLTVASGDGPIPCRCHGALYRESAGQAPALVLLRLARADASASRFLLLTQRIDDLSREVRRRIGAEEALRETTARYRVTLESIGDAVIATDGAGRVTFMNPVAEQLTGWSLNRAMGAHLDEIFVILNEDTRRSVESPVAKVLRHGGIVGLANHTVLVRADGSELPIDDSGAPIKNDLGNIIGVVLVFRDLSERHAFERELSSKTRQLQDADRRKDEFLSMLAHELRNPIAPLSNGVELLKRRHGSEPGILRLARMMERQVTHMVRLVDDLLDVARLTRGTRSSCGHGRWLCPRSSSRRSKPASPRWKCTRCDWKWNVHQRPSTCGRISRVWCRSSPTSCPTRRSFPCLQASCTWAGGSTAPTPWCR